MSINKIYFSENVNTLNSNFQNNSNTLLEVWDTNKQILNSAILKSKN